jgi:hypothetical protein
VGAVEEAKEKVREVGSRGRKRKDSLAKRVLVPLAASAVSGATAYAARKAPGFFQEKVWPKLKELASSGGALEKAKKAVEGAVPSSVPGLGSDGQQERPGRKLTDAQRAKQQRERATRRRERREALSR